MKRTVIIKLMLAWFYMLIVLATGAAAVAAEGATPPENADNASQQESQGRIEAPLVDRAARFFLDRLAREGKYGLVLQQPTTEIIFYPGGKMLVNGEETSAPTSILQRRGTTYLPLRAILEALGGSVEYDPATDQVKLYYGGRQATLNLKDSQVLLGEEEFDRITVAWQGARSLVPVRWLAEKLLVAMNPEEMFSVQWQADTGAVHLYRQRWEVTRLPETFAEPELTLYLLVPWGQFPYIQLAEMPSVGVWSYEGLPQLPPEFRGKKYTLATTKVPLIPGENHLLVQMPHGEMKITSPLIVQVDPAAIPFPYRLDARNYPLGWPQDITMVSPVSGYSEAEGEFRIDLTGIPQQVTELLLSFVKGDEKKSLTVPVNEGRFTYPLKPVFGKGVYDVSVSVPKAVSMPDHPDRSPAGLLRFWVRF